MLTLVRITDMQYRGAPAPISNIPITYILAMKITDSDTDTKYNSSVI